MPNYYPIMLDVRGRPVTVVGGNAVAAEKTAALLASGARVTVIALEVCAELQALAERGEIALRRKTYAPGDLAGAFIVVAAATYEPELAEAIWQETQQRGQPVNIVDLPDHCSFIVPSILRRGQLTIAVSTEGTSPALAKRIRQRLETLFPQTYGAYLRLAGTIRTYLKARGVSYAQRDEFFGSFFASDVEQRIAKGDTAGAAATTRMLLHEHLGAAPPLELEAELERAARSDGD